MTTAVETQTLPYVPRVPTDADWFEEPWQFFVGNPEAPDDITQASPDDFTGCTFSAGLTDLATGAVILTMSDGDGLLVTLPNIVVPKVPKATTRTLAPYAPTCCSFDLTCTRPTGYVEPLFSCQAYVARGSAP